MRRYNRESGAALILIVGVIAALAILGAALVALTANAASNTARDRDRAKAFNMAEAGVDYALYRLGTVWPTLAAGPITFSTTDEAAFLTRFPATEYPGADIEIVWFNDVDTNGDGVIDWTDGVPQDLGVDVTKEGNGRIFVEAQATVGASKARIQVEAQRVMFDTQIPTGIALVADGDVTANNKKSPVNADPANGGYMDDSETEIQAYAGGTFTNKNPNGTVCQTPPVTPHENMGTGIVDSILSPLTIQGLIQAAKARGSYYTSQPPTTADMEGLVVIQTADQIEFKDTYNGDGVSVPDTVHPKQPGFMLVIGPDGGPTSGGIKVQGNAKYYGILYTDGGMFGNGGTWVVGMLLAKGASVDLAGNREVAYNFRCVTGAQSLLTLNAQIVPNTWREIQPH